MPSTLTKPNLLMFLRDQGINDRAVFVPKSLYALPTLRWLDGPFARDVRTNVLPKLGPYITGKTECAEFAQAGQQRAKDLFRKTRSAPPGCGFAAATFGFTQRDGRGHVIDAFIVRQDGDLLLAFFDVQLARRIALTKTEIQSCTNMGF